MALRLVLAFIFSHLFLLCVVSKPTLDEEKRNLCEGEPNLAECLMEVEEAKAPSKDSTNTETKNGEEEEDPYEAIMKQQEKIKKMVDENEQNRAYWDEEYKSINKWA
ncbi:uncharacterized protein LOC116301074, partial [Actinia tenebrosa]|uniref:Uncharacterized protein LOC116301074 n=1 Tax=Actinia tenebrosa TaxID=6105 RepID=A0A6P8IH04_ACTTE